MLFVPGRTTVFFLCAALLVGACDLTPEWTSSYDGPAKLEGDVSGVTLEPSGTVMIRGATRVDYAAGASPHPHRSCEPVSPWKQPMNMFSPAPAMW
jgi:hypothetical protein